MDSDACRIPAGVSLRRLRIALIRRIVFQLHLWTGLASGLYILAICVTGSAVVFRRDMNKAFCSIDGFTCEPAWVNWLARFHGELLGGFTGMKWNGVGAILVMLMCLTGAILWWPSKGGWWRRMSVQWGSSGRRFLRDLHNMLGFWSFLLIVLWAFTGIYFAFPDIVNIPSQWFERDGEITRMSLFLQDAIGVLADLHFGRSYGLLVKILWALFGLVPCALFVTGALMWWKRRSSAA